ncbi:VIT domain-containing protein [Pseudoduganella rivuli]|nr:VIT domain-containing protein [Pseudoduganella rivuli]
MLMTGLRLISLFLLLCATPWLAAQPLMETLRGERPVRLQSLDIQSAVSGGMAETRVRMVFFNPNSRMLEGNLQFPLADGQHVTGFALDIDGAMRPAVPVEKSRGRQIIEMEERRGVDPALLEHTQGNQFRLRVYPIPAQGTRTVELTYAEPLARDSDGWAYRLPLAYANGVKDFVWNVDVQGAAGAPRFSGIAEAPAFGAKAGNAISSWQARLDRPVVQQVTVHIPAAQRVQAYVERFGNDTYFVAEVSVNAQRTARPLPRTVGLLWDASGSGARRAIDDELALLDRYFRALGNGEVRLVLLRDRPEAAQTFRIRDGDWDALRKVLRSVKYDGASALADWLPESGVQEYVLVSDGLLNYGARRFPVLASGQRLYAVNSTAGADTVRLAALAERNGGALVSVTPGQGIDAAAAVLLTDGPRIEQLRAEGAAELLADAGAMQQGLLRIAGKLTRATAQVNLSLARQGKAVPVTVQVDGGAATHPLAAWLWASYQLRALEIDHEANRGAIRRLGSQFGMPTRETSLLVLERMEDYVRHDVTPPASMLAAFDKLRAQQARSTAQRRDKQLDSVVRQFEQKIAWWENPPQKKRWLYKEDEAARQESQRMRRERTQEMGAQKAQPVEARMMEDARAPALNFAPSPPPPAPAAAPVASGMRADARPPMAEPKAGIGDKDAAPGQSIGIALKRWNASAPYIARMKAAAPDALYAIYLDEKPSWENSSAFYVDVADMLLQKGKRDLALRVLSNLAEMDLENRHVLRVLGYRLLQAGAPQLAVPVFEQVKQLAEEEPQSFRDLGLAYAAAGKRQEAIEHLYEVVLRPWDGRFAEVELIALAEMNAIIATAPPGAKPDTRQIDSRLLRNLPLDMRAVLTWDADNSDMDLWVVDPDGEKCYYGNQNTQLGGRLSRDFTGGYGPEEFSLRRARPGKYRVYANYFGDRQQLVTGATTLQLRLTTGFGTARAKDEMVTLRLKDGGSTVLVGEFEVR